MNTSHELAVDAAHRILFNFPIAGAPDQSGSAFPNRLRRSFMREVIKSGLMFSLLLLGIAASQGRVLGGEAKRGWEAEWEKTLQAAKKEGQVVLYATEGSDVIFREFEKKYPEIKVVSVLGRGSQIAQKVMAERRAGKYLADIYLGGSGTAYSVFYEGKVLDPLKPLLIVPEVADGSKWWSGRHIYHDDEGEYLLAYNGVAQSYFSYNTKIINPKEFTSYWDFLKPKWKGKVVSYDPTMGGAVSGVLMFFFHNPKLGPDYIRRLLTEADLTVTRDSHQLVNWLAVGKFPLAAMIPPDRAGVYDAKSKGLSVDAFQAAAFKEGAPLSTANGNMALFNRAPHPNAAKVAINWLLSREGQIVYQKIELDGESLRIDIPKDNVIPRIRRVKGVEYLVLAGPGFKNMDQIEQLVKESWKR
jgi:iron(III) transport system substrate-binding protein